MWFLAFIIFMMIAGASNGGFISFIANTFLNFWYMYCFLAFMITMGCIGYLAVLVV